MCVTRTVSGIDFEWTKTLTADFDPTRQDSELCGCCILMQVSS
jgi:hypothetical protein